MSVHRLSAPLKNDDVDKLRSGDQILISGSIITARDAAHKRLMEFFESWERATY